MLVGDVGGLATCKRTVLSNPVNPRLSRRETRYPRHRQVHEGKTNTTHTTLSPVFCPGGHTGLGIINGVETSFLVDTGSWSLVAAGRSMEESKSRGV